jgi:hypothetical protein
MIAATLAAGVLAAAPPVLDPVGGRKRGGKPLFGSSAVFELSLTLGLA